jgi:hypothetical protein
MFLLNVLEFLRIEQLNQLLGSLKRLQLIENYLNVGLYEVLSGVFFVAGNGRWAARGDPFCAMEL